jgi:two-component system NtrC family sensor kinase
MNVSANPARGNGSGRDSARSSAASWLYRLLALSVVVVLATFDFAASRDYTNVLRDARQRAEQTAHLARGHAFVVLQREGGFTHDSAEELTRLYERVFAEDASVGMALFHADGSLLAAYPRGANVPARLSPDSPIMRAMMSGADSAVAKVNAPDKRSRLVAFQKVDPYPVFVHVALDYSSLMAQWREDLLVHLSFLLPALLCLVLVTRVAINKTRLEHAALTRNAAMEDELRQAHKLEALGQLTGGIVHDFKNILNVVRMNATVLAMKLRGTELAKPVEALERAAESGSKLTEHLLAFARQQVLQPVMFEPVRSLPLICELCRRSLPSHVKLDVDVAPETWPVMVDVPELEVALLNLVLNARDAMPDGGTITVGARNLPRGEAKKAGLPDRDIVAISVEDSGHGIPADVLPRIFDPFFTTKEPGKGTGLGLSRIYGFAQQSGGKVRARNRPGGGAILTLYLPRLAR